MRLLQFLEKEVHGAFPGKLRSTPGAGLRELRAQCRIGQESAESCANRWNALRIDVLGSIARDFAKAAAFGGEHGDCARESFEYLHAESFVEGRQSNDGARAKQLPIPLIVNVPDPSDSRCLLDEPDDGIIVPTSASGEYE